MIVMDWGLSGAQIFMHLEVAWHTYSMADRVNSLDSGEMVAHMVGRLAPYCAL